MHPVKLFIPKPTGGLYMNRRLFLRNTLAGAAGSMAGLLPMSALANNDVIRLTILHTNDLHSRIEPFEDSHPRFAGRGGFARVAGFVNSCRQENPNLLLLDAGDFFQGTPYFNFYGGELLFDLMTKMGYDAATLGNHEFDNGLQGLLDPLPRAGFPIINSNYDFSGTILEGKFPRYMILNKGGLKIGIYGLGIELSGLVNQKQYGGVRYTDPVSIALEMESYLSIDRSCDLVVCLSHLGFQYQNEKISDMALAPLTNYTDLIIGGHTHTYLEEPVSVVNKLGRTVLVNQAHTGGLAVGRLDFVFERESGRNKKLLSASIAML